VRIEYLIDFQTLFTYLHAGLTHSRKVLVTFVCTIVGDGRRDCEIGVGVSGFCPGVEDSEVDKVG